MDYCSVQQLFDGVIPFHQYRCYWKSLYLEGLSNQLIDELLEINARPPSPNTLSSIWNFGGGTAAVLPEATAFGDRSMPYMLSIDSTWSDAKDDDANLGWSRSTWNRLQPHSHNGRAYLNFAGLGEDNEALIRRSYGGNLDRLAKVKGRYDPTNLFRSNENVRPAQP